jgi:hypothetical protein
MRSTRNVTLDASSRRTLPLADDRDENLSAVRRPPVFEQKNALPCAELHFAIDDRHGLAGTCQNHADVRRHVVAAFGTVCEIISIFWYEPLEELFEVVARRWIGILHDDNAATGVLHEDCCCPIFHPTFIDRLLHFISDLVQSFACGTEFELMVVDTHHNAD